VYNENTSISSLLETFIDLLFKFFYFLCSLFFSLFLAIKKYIINIKIKKNHLVMFEFDYFFFIFFQYLVH